MGWIFGVGLSLSILYHPTAVERNGHCADSGPCGALRAGGRVDGGGKGEGSKRSRPGNEAEAGETGGRRRGKGDGTHHGSGGTPPGSGLSLYPGSGRALPGDPGAPGFRVQRESLGWVIRAPAVEFVFAKRTGGHGVPALEFTLTKLRTTPGAPNIFS